MLSRLILPIRTNRIKINVQLKALSTRGYKNTSILFNENENKAVQKMEYERFNTGPSFFTRYRNAIYGSLIVLGVYIVASIKKDPVFGRYRVHLFSLDGRGKSSYESLQNQYKVLPDDHPYSKQLERVAKRLIKAAPGSNFNWEVCCLDDPTQNAACLPGGKIVFWKGIMDLLGDDDTQIAAVMAHEISHALLQHHNSQIGILFLPIRLFLGLMGFGTYSANLLLAAGVTSFSRTNEHDADILGMYIMSRACYNPNKAKNTFYKLKSIPGINKYLSTHPTHGDRVELMNKNATNAVQEGMKCCQYKNNEEYLRDNIPVWHSGLKQIVVKN
ncbi:oma1 [Acrasis kona]|uniref:Oma1 n=1 Tax=Acrasis kona TaxID=1008807 RepID=A0AAW2YGM7_9EUKA